MSARIGGFDAFNLRFKLGVFVKVHSLPKHQRESLKPLRQRRFQLFTRLRASHMTGHRKHDLPAPVVKYLAKKTGEAAVTD